MFNLNHNYSIEIEKYIQNEIFVDKIYHFNSYFTNYPIIIDCGANVGFSIVYFKMIYPKSIIFAFEPEKEYYTFLEKNIKECQFDNITLYNSAVTDKDGNIEFYSKNKKNSYGIPVSSLFKNEFADNKVYIETISLGKFVKQFNEVDFLKIDVEGSESSIIKSLVKNETLCKIREIVIEYHHWVNQEYKFNEFTKILESNNFNVEIIKEEQKLDNWSISGNTILRATNKIKRC